MIQFTFPEQILRRCGGILLAAAFSESDPLLIVSCKHPPIDVSNTSHHH
jgi:hypothetical protein